MIDKFVLFLWYKFMYTMEVFNYLNGQGGFMILAFFVVVVVLYRKYKSYRYFKDMKKARKNKQK